MHERTPMAEVRKYEQLETNINKNKNEDQDQGKPQQCLKKYWQQFRN